MDAKNLAIVFGGVIFGEEELPKGSDILSIQTWKVRQRLFRIKRLVTRIRTQ